MPNTSSTIFPKSVINSLSQLYVINLINSLVFSSIRYCMSLYTVQCTVYSVHLHISSSFKETRGHTTSIGAPAIPFEEI